METSSGEKLKKLSEAEDRISNLSDDVLHNVLSFIPAVDSVSTCILSTRWKDLWKHVPVLTFDDTPNRRTKSHYVRFASFVRNVLSSHVPKVLEKLSLTCFENHVLYDVENWLSDSITRNIQSLDLTIYNDSPAAPAVQLPSSLFTCKTLEALVVQGSYRNIIVNIPTYVCLPKLKTMELIGLEYHRGDQKDCLDRLISSCSSLESVVVEDQAPVNGSVGFRTISSSTLRYVTFRLWESRFAYNPEIFCSSLRRLNLSISFDLSWRMRVPSNIFTCETLEQLILEGRLLIRASTTICLPSLIYLELIGVRFEDGEIFSTLISSCTSLESLVVEKLNNDELNISSCTLKVIKVDKPGRKLVINAPALKCLKLVNSGCVDCQFQELASLEQFDVDIRLRSYYSSSVLTNAYEALQHVKRLKICEDYHPYVDVFEHALPIFNRLTDLDININSRVGYVLFEEIIKKSAKLESLACELRVKALRDRYWKKLNTVPACLLSSLRSVLIRKFKGREDELAMISYILGNAKIMEKMEVCFSRHFRRSKAMKRELCKKILNVHRASEKCEVIFFK